MTGLFISFEGPEGAGKSTQIERLARHLDAVRVSYTLTREPGGTALGMQVRSVLLDHDLEIHPLSEFLLYSASRAQLVQDVIRPALQGGEVVICDRYADSSAAYQGAGRGLEARFVSEVTWEATGGLRPHITVLLDLDPEVGLKRAAARGQPDRLERTDLQFHQRVRQGFLDIAAAEPERVLVLEAGRSEDALADTIWAAVSVTLEAMGKLKAG